MAFKFSVQTIFQLESCRLSSRNNSHISKDVSYMFTKFIVWFILKNTRSSKSKDSKDLFAALCLSKRRKILQSDKDQDIWDQSDTKIIGKKKVSSFIYQWHHDLKNQCDSWGDGEIEIIFIRPLWPCYRATLWSKWLLIENSVQIYLPLRFYQSPKSIFEIARKQHNTTSLSRGMKACFKRRGADGDSSMNAQQNVHRIVSTYLEHYHRAFRRSTPPRSWNAVPRHQGAFNIDRFKGSTDTISEGLKTGS